ncbi:hypothetical protein GCM10010517_22580 [Streptosporangium fragile]|uniref:Uncharacterized protein n=1 Tax=Streptosporangium fragile TaxID=46186 RepID=A0ABN3VVT0_9ACTN
MARHVRTGIGAGVTAAAVIGLGVYFMMVGPDKADKIASSIGVLVAVVALAVTVYGLTAPSPAGRRVSQRATASDRGRIHQIGGSTGIGEGTAVDGAVTQRATAAGDGAVTQVGGDQAPSSAPPP